jgi:BirA family biotin operon repressor/biotin-[acetyl-CoA-carboxylase] ligase
MQPKLERERDIAWERALSEGLDTAIVGRPLLAFNEVGSTNDVAKEMAERHAPDGLAILARHQWGGRGRRGRNWFSFPGGAVCLSIVLRPRWEADRAALLGVLGAVAAADALDALGIREISIKWPNDILASGRKIAGVLVEPRIGEGRLSFAVIGIGLNVRQTEADWPEELRPIATSCAMQGVAASVDDAARELMRRVDAWYLQLLDGKLDAIMNPWTRWTGSDRLPILD